MENTNKDQAEQLNETAVKCRFFSQYLHSIVNKNSVLTTHQLYDLWRNDFEGSFLSLKTLSNIIDKDCCELFDILYPNAVRFSTVEKIVDIKTIIRNNLTEDVFSITEICFIVDFLRSKGYALPYLNYTVDDLVKMGWVQLI